MEKPNSVAQTESLVTERQLEVLRDMADKFNLADTEKAALSKLTKVKASAYIREYQRKLNALANVQSKKEEGWEGCSLTQPNSQEH